MSRSRIKIIWDVEEKRLQKKINKFLRSSVNIKKVLDIKYAMTVDQDHLHYSALVHYKLKRTNRVKHLLNVSHN